MPLNCCLMAGAQRALRLAPNQARLKGALNLSEALLGLKASEGTSVWTFRDFLLIPGGCFSAAVERPFCFSGWFCSFWMSLVPSLVCHSDSSLQGNATDSKMNCREWQGQELSQENAPSFSSLIFHSILVCLKGLSGAMWGNVLFENCIPPQFFWKKMSREKNRVVIWAGFSEMLPGQDNGEEQEIFLSMKWEASHGTKKKVQLCHRNYQILCEHHVKKSIRTKLSIDVKPHNCCETGLIKFYHITNFLSKIHSTSQVTWTSEFWGVSSGELCLVRAISLWNSQG